VLTGEKLTADLAAEYALEIAEVELRTGRLAAWGFMAV
jgi:hypothetical protein